MREFFRGWRRKVGCVTLVMALAIMAMWVRSLFFADQLSFSVGHRTLFVASCLSGLCVMSIDQTTGSAMAWRTVSAEGFEPNETLAQNLSEQTTELVAIGVNPVCHYLLYWWIVAPLTILSAYLILWKPRKRV